MFKFTIKFNDNFQIILANIFFLLPNINSILFRLEEGEPKKFIEKVYFKNNDIFLNKE